MFSAKSNKNPLTHSIGILLFTIAASSLTFAQGPSAYLRLARVIETGALGISSPAGLAFSPAASALLVLENRNAAQPPVGVANIIMITLVEDPAGTVNVVTAIPDPINMAFDSPANRLLLFEIADKLAAIRMRPDGLPDPAAITRFEARQFGLQNSRGMAIDPASGDLFILDNAARRIVRIIRGAGHSFDGDAALREGRISQVDLNLTGVGDLRGLAFNPNNGHLYLLSLAKHTLYELTPTGQVVSSRDLSASDDFNLIDPQGMVFAPSGDVTDDPELMNLYIADSGRKNEKPALPKALGRPGLGRGRILELSLTQPATIDFSTVSTVQATLVQTSLTSLWSPPSPDPMGAAYIFTSNRLMISDSEVEEMSIFAGVNLFDATRQGGLVNAFSTISFSDEPTGVAFNPSNRHLFISDDDADEIFEIDPGADEQYFTADDIRTSFDTRSINHMDAEGIAYGNGSLYIADGVNSEVWEISPGPNGRFDGPPPAGDDLASHFDTSFNGVPDPEAVEFNSSTGNLYITGRGEKKVIETTTSGALLTVIDITSLKAKNPSGLAYAPGSIDPAAMSLYIVARGTDNDTDPSENDGKMFEISVGSSPPPTPSIFINNVTVSEGNSGTVNANFALTLSAPGSQAVTVDYATADGTATAASDYVAASGLVSFPAGTTTQMITVVVNGDALAEPNETFFVNLSNPSNATIADNQGQCTINDDDQPWTTITLNPTDDARVKSTEPTSNFGTSGTLRLRQSSTIYRSYLKFVVNGVSSSVLSAKLRLKVTQASNSGGSVFWVSNDYLGTSTPWTELGLNYNNAPSLDGTPLSTVASVTVGQVVEFDVTAAITGNGTYSFGLRNSSSTEVQYSSKEGSTVPELVIQFGSGAAPKAPDMASGNGEATGSRPERLELSPNYPNPFGRPPLNVQTVIDYALPEAARVRLVVYNVLGQQVRKLVDEIQAAGYKRVIWDGKDAYGHEAGSGIYLYQLEVGRQTLKGKLVLQR